MIKKCKIDDRLTMTYSDSFYLIADKLGNEFFTAYDVVDKSYAETDIPIPTEALEMVKNEIRQTIGGNKC